MFDTAADYPPPEEQDGYLLAEARRVLRSSLHSEVPDLDYTDALDVVRHLENFIEAKVDRMLAQRAIGRTR